MSRTRPFLQVSISRSDELSHVGWQNNHIFALHDLKGSNAPAAAVNFEVRDQMSREFALEICGFLRYFCCTATRSHCCASSVILAAA